MAVPSERQILDTLAAFAIANPASTQGDARDDLVATFAGRNSDANGAISAITEVYVQQGYEDDANPANATWGKFRNRCAAVGIDVAMLIARDLRQPAAARPEVQVYRLRIQRDEVVAARGNVDADRDEVQAFRDLQFPLGAPLQTDPVRIVWDKLTEALQALSATIQGLNAERDQLDVQITSLGG